MEANPDGKGIEVHRDAEQGENAATDGSPVTGQSEDDDGRHGLGSPVLAVLFIVGCVILGLALAFGIASAPDWLGRVNGNLPRVILGGGTGIDREMAPENDSELDVTAGTSIGEQHGGER